MAVLPEEKKEHAAFFIRLLTMNHGFSGTGGACLRFDPQQDVMAFRWSGPLPTPPGETPTRWRKTQSGLRHA